MKSGKQSRARLKAKRVDRIAPDHPDAIERPIEGESKHNFRLFTGTEATDLRTVFHVREAEYEIEKRVRESTKPLQRTLFPDGDARAAALRVASMDPETIELPRRPVWVPGTDKEEQQTMETEGFESYISAIYDKYPPERLNHFEHNIQVWRELWRVCEFSDVLIITADARHPLFHVPVSLYRYICVHLRKQAILVLNKVDLVSKAHVKRWKDFFAVVYPGLHIFMFSSFPQPDTITLEEDDATVYGEKHKGRGKLKGTRHDPLLSKPEGVHQLIELLRQIRDTKLDLEKQNDDDDEEKEEEEEEEKQKKSNDEESEEGENEQDQKQAEGGKSKQNKNEKKGKGGKEKPKGGFFDVLGGGEDDDDDDDDDVVVVQRRDFEQDLFNDDDDGPDSGDEPSTQTQPKSPSISSLDSRSKSSKDTDAKSPKKTGVPISPAPKQKSSSTSVGSASSAGSSSNQKKGSKKTSGQKQDKKEVKSKEEEQAKKPEASDDDEEETVEEKAKVHDKKEVGGDTYKKKKSARAAKNERRRLRQLKLDVEVQKAESGGLVIPEEIEKEIQEQEKVAEAEAEEAAKKPTELWAKRVVIDDKKHKKGDEEEEEDMGGFDEDGEGGANRKKKDKNIVPRALLVGLVGHPNTGKSSLINALMGKPVVNVSATPGHTKHMQSGLRLPSQPDIELADCPGLVFPMVDVPRPLQVLNGLFPPAQVREPFSTVQYLAERVPLEKIYRLKPPNLPTTEGEDDLYLMERRSNVWSAWSVCEALAAVKGYKLQGSSELDTPKAGHEIIRSALSGALLLRFDPPPLNSLPPQLIQAVAPTSSESAVHVGEKQPKKQGKKGQIVKAKVSSNLVAKPFAKGAPRTKDLWK